MNDKFQELSKDELTKIVGGNSSQAFGAGVLGTILVCCLIGAVAGGLDSYYKVHNGGLSCLLAAVCSTVVIFVIPILLWQEKRLSALIELLRKSDVIT